MKIKDSVYDYDNIERFAYENGLVDKYRQELKEHDEDEGVEPYDYSDSEIFDIYDEEIENEYYDYLAEVYYDTIDEVNDYCRNYVDEYNDENETEIEFDVEKSGSWSGGRFASVYFKFYKCTEEDEDSDVYEIRISDGHNNGRMTHDYEIIFDEYDEDELKEILDDIVRNLTNE